LKLVRAARAAVLIQPCTLTRGIFQFFRTTPLPSDLGHGDGLWSLEGEALMVANLEQVCAGLRQASSSPVYVPAQRISRLDALSSLYACSVEGRQSQVYKDLPADGRVSLSALFTTTRIRRCHGWVRLQRETVAQLNRYIAIDERRARKGDLVPAYFEPGKHYSPPARFDVDAVQRQIDFFHYAGFTTCQPENKANWQGPGIKLDFGDYRTPSIRILRGARTTCHQRKPGTFSTCRIRHPIRQHKSRGNRRRRPIADWTGLRPSRGPWSENTMSGTF
jgi:hypothetical protein